MLVSHIYKVDFQQLFPAPGVKISQRGFYYTENITTIISVQNGLWDATEYMGLSHPFIFPMVEKKLCSRYKSVNP